MTPKQISMVQQTWKMVVPIGEQAATLFYGKLFEMDPAVRPLFKADMKEQGRKLTAMINTAVNGLSSLDVLVPAVQKLGRKHVGYGVRPEHYDTVGAALLWTLEQGLGQAFTAEVKDAWATVYNVLAKCMKEAAYAPA